VPLARLLAVIPSTYTYVAHTGTRGSLASFCSATSSTLELCVANGTLPSESARVLTRGQKMQHWLGRVILLKQRSDPLIGAGDSSAGVSSSLAR